tara:strand:+ start:76 stop:1908 length:1833 start_codon:yes stop_codon:yes gene_type:complete
MNYNYLQKAIEEIEEYAIILLDKDGFIINWNKGAEKIKGYSKEEIIGKNFRQFYPLSDREIGKPELLIKRAIEEGKAQDEGWRVKKDGSTFWANVTITASHDDDGNITGFSKVTRDLSEKKYNQERISRLNKAINEIEDYAIILLDRDGTIQHWNKGAQNIKGYTSDEIIGENFKQFYPPADQLAGKPEKLIYKALKEGRAQDEGLRVKKNGDLFWANVVITAVHDDNGNVDGFIKITRDLSEKRKAEERMVELNQAISEIEDCAIILLGRDGTVLNWNKGAENIKGYLHNEIIGKNFKQFYTHEDIRNHKPDSLLTTAIAKGIAHDEGWRVRKDGSTFWANVTITAVHDSNGNITGFSKITRDLTERKKAEEQRLNHLKEIEAKNKELEQFSYLTSHDLQEPLRTVSTFVDLFQQKYKDHFDEMGIQSLEYISEATQRMQDLILGLMKYNQIGDSRELSSIDCNQLVKDVISDLNSSITEYEASIQIADLPTLEAYQLEMRLLFQNLLSNALKFHKPNTNVTIKIFHKENDVDHIFAIKDNGIGIDNRHEQRIFSIFQRLNERSSYSGTGIGLAHCKKIVDLHDGKIWVESELNEGSTFYFSIPKTSVH